jgi:hypothetical protein
MLTALRIYNIFYLNKQQVENSLDAYACWLQTTGCQTKPMPLTLKAKATTILINFKFKKMQTQKMSLANMQGKLSRAEMKNIMAGSGTCQALVYPGTGGISFRIIGLSAAEARNYPAMVHWCCSSCSTASWAIQ